jgi:hypothetical protein
VEEATEDSVFGGIFDIGVLESKKDCRATQFEYCRLEILSS